MGGSDRSVAFRTDASSATGSGHLMRCLTLAKRLRDGGAQVSFVNRDLPGDLSELVRAHGYRVDVISAPTMAGAPEPAPWHDDLHQTIEALRARRPFDWVIVDHYELDEPWEHGVRAIARRVMVIDDLANRRHDCDLLLDQNYYRNAETRYRGLVPAHCELFLGPRFALLRDEFLRTRPRERIEGRVDRVLVFFGGADLTGETEKALRALQHPQLSRLDTDVVVGASNPRVEEIRRLCAARPNVVLHVQTDRMAELMWLADLAIGASGTTTWERFRCGLPTITVVTADNQLETATDLAAAEAIWYLGRAEELAPLDYERALFAAVAAPRRLAEMAARATYLVGGGANGVRDDGISRITRALLESESTLD